MSYANVRRKPLEFQVRDRVMLKVSPRKGVIRFRKRGKLNPRYIGQFKILKRVGPVAYTLELPEELSNVHSTFYVSNLKKCLSDESLVIPMKELQLCGRTNRNYGSRSQATETKSYSYSQKFEKTFKKRITPTRLTEGERGFEQTKEFYLTEVIPFFNILKDHFQGIQKALTKEIKEMKEIFEELEAEVDQNVVNRKYDEIEQKNLLIANDILIADCLSKEVFYIATNSELTVSRFTEMHDAHTVVQARCLELEAELSKLHDKVQKDDHTKLVKRFSNLEVNHLNLQLNYQNLKESFGNNTSPPTRDAPDFDSVFVIEKMKASIQGKDNAIKKLRMQISQLKETCSEADHTLDFRALDFQITQLTKKVTVL
ncbi:hypothetical protein Tco_0695742 [Tanacetum coccineum]